MSVVLKQTRGRFKDQNGEYVDINVVAEQPLSEAITAIETKGAQTLESIPDDYTALSNEVDELKEDLSEVVHFSTNLVPNTNYLSNSFLEADGSITFDNSYKVTDYFKVTGGKKYIRSSITYIAWYDDNKNFISRVQANPSTAPANARYARCTTNAISSAWQVNEGEVLLDYEVPSVVTLNENVNITKHIDVSLTEQGKCADAKKTGDLIFDLQNDVSGMIDSLYEEKYIPVTGFVGGAYIKTGVLVGTVIDVNNPVSDTSSLYYITPVKSGDKFKVYGRSYSAPRLWCFTDSDYKMVTVCQQNITITEENKAEIVAPTDGFLIVNGDKTAPYALEENTVVPRFIVKEKSPFERDDVSGYSHDYSTWYSGMFGEYPNATEQGWSFKYSDALSLMDSLVSADSNYVTKYKLGDISSVDESGNTYSIYEYVFKPKNYNSYSKKKHPKILIDGCIHGFEKNSFFGIYYFLYDLVHNWHNNISLENMRSNIEIHFIPVLNPWGFDRNERRNENGVNLNRNYDAPNWTANEESGDEPFDQQETAISRDWMIANKDAVFYFNVHTNGHYNANGYGEMNANMAYTDFNEPVYNKMFNAFKTHIEKQTLMFPKMYEFMNPTANEFCGKEQNANWVGTGKIGYSDSYISYYHQVPAMTLEGCNGLVVNEQSVFAVLSSASKKINSEIFGNMICQILVEYLK